MALTAIVLPLQSDVMRIKLQVPEQTTEQGSQQLPAQRIERLQEQRQQRQLQKASEAVVTQQRQLQQASEPIGTQQRQLQQASEAIGTQHRQLQQASEPIVTQTPVSWTVTENELRDSLSQYSAHRLLHITDMGHVVLNTFRAWDRRRSHASLDRWRFLLYAPVH